MYEVKVKTKRGSCESELFEKMAKKGDLTAIKISEIIGKEVSIIGYANCEIKTEDNEFTILYVDTKEYGLISSGSEIFEESIVDYYGECERFRIAEIKTKKGKTYKAVPIISQNKDIKEDKNEDLPF